VALHVYKIEAVKLLIKKDLDNWWSLESV